MSIGGIKFYNVSGHTGTSSIYLSTNNYLETNQIITSQIGFNAGLTGQGTGAVAFGYQAGESNQSAGALAFGYKAGQTSQGTGSIAIGYLAGQTNESANAVAIGNNAGQTSQGTGSIAIGSGAGQTNESANAVAIGNNAGQTSQGTGSIAIGYLAGQTNEGTNAVAIGNNAGQISQGTGSIAIGYLAGQNNQGTNSIAVGNLAGPTGMKANSIALNASGVPLHATGPTGGFYVNPIADYTNSLTIGNTGYFKLMMYGTDNQVVNIDPNDLPYPITNVKKTLENNTFKIAYDYPYQFLGGPFYLPFITTLNIEIKADTPSNFPSNFKDLPLTIQDRSSFSIKTPSNLNVVTNIYIFNTSTQYTNFNVLNQNAINHGPGPGSSGYIYYIYIPPAICNNSTLSLSIWYSNGNGDSVKTNIPAINLIQTVYSPAAPVVGINGTVLSYLPPDSLELSNQMVTYTLTDAFQNYKTNTDIRFNTSNNPPTQNKNNYTLTKPTYDIFNELGLTPESLYNITVNAIGSIQGNSSTKTTTTSLSITTPIFTPNFYSDIMKINGASKTGTTINIPVSNLGSTTDKAKSFQTNLEDYIEKVPLFISFSMPTIYLQNNISKRGNLSGTNDLMTVSLTCNRTNGERFTIGPFAINATSNQTGTFEGASIVGFGSSKPSFDYTITDSQTLPNLQGFYKNISFHVVIPDDTMTSSLTVTYSNDNCDPTTFNTVVFNYGTDASLDYVYDGPYSLPTIDFTASTITIDPSTILNQVCGISVANASPTLTFNSTLKNVSNIGKYYYNTNQIILYSFTTTPSSGSVTLTNTSLTTIDQPLTNTSYFTIDNNGNYHINQGIQISKTITTNISSNLYFQQIKVNTALYNPINDIGSYNFVLPIIYDTISLRSTLRVTSVNAGNELVRPNSSVSIIEPFDNTAFLTGTNELLYTNGMYVTPGLDSPEKYYIDYSNTYYGTNVPNPNYTSIVTNETNPRSTIYRYATFPYNVTNLVGIISCSFSRINITINNTSREIFSDSNNIIYINNSKLLLFYRIQIDQIPVNNGIGPLNPYANIPDNNGSTNWVDCNQRGNDLNIIETTVSTDNDTGLYTYGYPNFIFDSTNNVSNNISPTTAIIQRNLPYQMNPIPPKSTSNFTPSYNIIIFLRIGVPMNVPFSFTDISIQLIN